VRNTAAIVWVLWAWASAASDVVGEQHFNTAPPVSEPGPDTIWLLDVPYLPQTEALCGGAAAIDRDQRGIPTGVLATALQQHGWEAIAFHGSVELSRAYLFKGRPLLVLLEDAPGVFHYVVWVGWTSSHVVVHDPSKGPYRLVKEQEFHKAWAATDHWTLLVLPTQDVAGRRPVHVADSPAPSTSAGCSSMVDEAVRLARVDDLEGAEEILTASVTVCPESSAPLRELSGVRFQQSRWEDAARLAEQAVVLNPKDTHAWRMLAASRFLEDDLDGALRAWNEVGEPQIDLIHIDGLDRTRFDIVADLIELPPRSLLTDNKLRLARRRLAALPVQMKSRVGYRPLPGGLAQVDAALVERSLLFQGAPGLISTSLDAVFEREISMKLSSPTGGGELWTASWRWWEERPRVSLSLAVPQFAGFRGVWQMEGFWEQQSYSIETLGEADSTTENAVVREERRRVALALGGWSTADSRWELVAGLDRWEDQGSYFSLGGALEKRLAGDRIALRMEGEGWSGLNKDNRFALAALRTAWRSSTGEKRAVLLARGALVSTTSTAPLALWPGAGVGHACTVADVYNPDI